MIQKVIICDACKHQGKEAAYSVKVNCEKENEVAIIIRKEITIEDGEYKHYCGQKCLLEALCTYTN